MTDPRAAELAAVFARLPEEGRANVLDHAQRWLRLHTCLQVAERRRTPPPPLPKNVVRLFPGGAS